MSATIIEQILISRDTIERLPAQGRTILPGKLQLEGRTGFTSTKKAS